MSKWIEKEIGELIIERPKSKIQVADATGFGEFPFFTSGDSVLLHNQKLTENENIYLATGGTANAKYYDGEAAFSTDTYVVSAKNGIDTKFLYYYLLKNLCFINNNFFEGSGLKHLQKNDLKEWMVSFPEDAEEQKQIAAIFSKADELIEATQTLIDKQKKVKTGLMQTLLTCGIDDKGVIRAPKTHKFKDSELGPIPEEWQCVELGRLSNMCLGKMLDSKKNKGKNKFYLRNENVQWQYFDMLDLDQMPFEGHEIERYSIRKGDVVMCEGGEPGRCAVWDADNVEMYFQKALHRIRCKKALYNHFLVYEFMYLNMNNVLSDYFTGTTIMHLTGMSLDKFLIKIPSLPEQDRIVSVLQQQDQIIKDLENEKQKYIDIKKGLMADLLTGKVKVSS